MNKCDACGKPLTNSKSTCECAAASRNDEKIPLIPGIAFLLTAAIEFLIIRVKGELASAELAAGAMGAGMVLLAILGSVLNFSLVSVAQRRGEDWGWRQAALGTAVWIVTIIL